MSDSSSHKIRSRPKSQSKKYDSVLAVEPLLVKSKSFHDFQPTIPLACKLIYSQGKLVHSYYETVPEWFLRKVKVPKVEPRTGEVGMKELQGFFRGNRRLNLSDADPLSLAQTTDLLDLSRKRLQDTTRKFGKKRISSSRHFFLKSKRNRVRFLLFEVEERVLSFPDKLDKDVQHHTRDDDVDTDEEQMNQGVFVAFTNILQGIKENELRRRHNRLRFAGKSASSGSHMDRASESDPVESKGESVTERPRNESPKPSSN